MCGRYSLHDADSFSEIRLEWPADWTPSWNIAPTDNAVVLVAGAHGPKLELQQWGLLPGWATLKQVVAQPKQRFGDDLEVPPQIRWVKNGAPLFNARDDQLDKRWRRPFEKRRCIVLANGFYEWSGTAQFRQPYYITVSEAPLYGMAGIWAERQMPDGEILRTFSIVTCPPNELVRPIHDRMPVILSSRDHDTWLSGTPAEARQLTLPFAAERMELNDVNPLVNSGRNDGPDLHVVTEQR